MRTILRTMYRLISAGGFKLISCGLIVMMALGVLVSASPSQAAGAPVASGYWLATANGGVYALGGAGFYGSMDGQHLNRPIVGLGATADGRGYWLLGSDGGMFAFGDARFFGSMGGAILNRPMVGVAATPDGGGYWQVASDGGIFAFGDARFFGSMGASHLNAPIVAMAATPDGGGYWLVASDGGIFAFGDARFFGSMGASHLNAPIVGISASADGGGYRLVASDGGIFAFGDAPFYGSVAGSGSVVSGVCNTLDGAGYWMTTATGRVYAFGDAPVYGSAAASSVIGIAPSQGPPSGGPGVVPGPPTITKAVAGNAQVTLTWAAGSAGSNPIAGYVVVPYSGTVALSPVTFSGNPALSETITGLTNGTGYSFTVAAISAAGTGTASAHSAVVTAVAPARAPGAPVSVVAVSGVRSISVSWSPPADLGSPALSGYKVTPYISGVAGSTVSVGSGVTSTTVSGLTNGTSYTVGVVAVGAGGSSPVAFSGNVIPSSVPGAPGSVVAVGAPGAASVTWSAPSDMGGLAISSYVITAYLGASAVETVQAGGSASNAVVSGLVNGDSYTFSVVAVNADGAGAASSPSAPVTPASVPGAPVIGAASVATGTTVATVTWSAPSSNGGAAVSGYVITPWLGGVSQSSVSVGAVTSGSVSGLNKGVAYTFSVAAINRVGVGASSSQSNQVVATTAPGIVTGVTASVANSQITLSWNPPADTGGLAVSYYLAPVGAALPYSTKATSFTFSGLREGKAYSFVVIASNSDGNGPASAVSNSVTIPPKSTGYWIVGSDGSIKPFGNAAFYGSMAGQQLASPIVGIASTYDNSGTWEVGADGGVFAFGDAGFFGSAASSQLNKPIVAIEPTYDNQGYWLVASDGGVFAYGDAGFYGSTGGKPLPGAIVAMVVTPDGTGYWLVGADGSVYPYGSAKSYGSMAGVSLNSPIVGMTSSADGGGYWLVGADGGIFSFGDAAFYGGLGGQTLNSPIVGITSSASGKGYWLVGADGGIFAFGDAPFDGSASGQFGSGVHAVGVAQTTSLTAGVVVKIPGAPTGAAAIGGNAAALVGWTAPVDTGGLSITGYAVTPLLNGVPQTTQTFTGSATAVIVNGLTGIGNYTFVVAAINGVGVGPQSGPSNAVTTVTVGAGKPASGSSGYDISNWQCSGYPPAAAIGIIEVTGYLGSSTAYNPCLSGEAAWAGSGLGYYVFMSGGSDGSIPGQCAGNASCAHGWNGAAAAYAHVANLGLNTHVVWWLDVESDPSWSSNTAANQSVVQGAVSYLQSQGVTVGIYTGNYSWNAIVGRWQPNLPLWVADYAGLSGATTCADEPAWAANAGAALPTGGLWMMQYTDTAAGSFDGDWAC